MGLRASSSHRGLGLNRPRSRSGRSISSARISTRLRRHSTRLKRASVRVRRVAAPDKNEPTDAALVSAALGGERMAFEKLMARHETSVRLLVRKLLHNLDLVEDVTQDVFLKAYSQLSKLSKPDRFSSWLMQIAANRSRDLLRWERRRLASMVDIDRHRPFRPQVASRAALELSMGQTTSPFETQELRAKLVTEIEELHPRYRLVAHQTYLNDQTPSEISDQHGMTEEVVKHRLRRARERLRIKLRKWKPISAARPKISLRTSGSKNNIKKNDS